MTYKELSLEQTRQTIDTRQVWEALLLSKNRLSSYKGSLSWQEIKGHEYLIKKDKIKGKHITKSLGRRTEETEKFIEMFKNGKFSAQEAVKGQSSRLLSMARINRAMRLQRVPLATAKVLRVLDGVGLLGPNLMVVGTNAIFAYEAYAGLHIDSKLLSTGDLDIMFNAKSTLKLAYNEEPRSLIDILKEADSSYQQTHKGGFRVVNSEGFYHLKP